MKLNKNQIKIVELEFQMYRVFEPSFRKISRRLWNVLKQEVWVTFKDGEFVKADQDGW